VVALTPPPPNNVHIRTPASRSISLSTALAPTLGIGPAGHAPPGKPNRRESHGHGKIQDVGRKRYLSECSPLASKVCPSDRATTMLPQIALRLIRVCGCTQERTLKGAES
jgi:hypothetical protein